MSDPGARTAVVTGANRGIGREAARLLSRAGISVVLTGRDPAACAAAAEEIAAEAGSHSRLAHHKLDVAESLEAFRGWLHDEGLVVDILVNNAGVLSDEDTDLLAAPEAVFRATFEVNFFGPLRLCRAFLPGMIERDYGRVVNVSSGWGSINDMGGGKPAAYKLSKAALNAMTRIAAGEVRGNVKINAVDPGWVRTRMGGRSASRSPKRAAADIVWAATLPGDGPNGGFFYARKPQSW